MDQVDITAMMRGVAPVLRDYVARAVDEPVREVSRAIEESRGLRDAVEESQRDLRRELEAQSRITIAELRARIAELEAGLARSIEERLAVRDTGIAELQRIVAELVGRGPPLAGPPGPPGEKGDPGVPGEPGPPGESIKGEKGEPGESGADGRDGERGPQGDRGERGIDGSHGQPGPRGEIGEVGREGPLGPAGPAGADGREWRSTGAYEPEAAYLRCDVVSVDGNAFVATRDDPGPCPGDGWRNFVQRGRPGKPGPKGDRGERGAAGLPAATITEWLLEPETYRAIAVLSDGTRAEPLELRGLFEQFLTETRG